MMHALTNWLRSNRNLISNSGALVGTAVVNSSLGFIYWWLAAKFYDQAVVGFASAVVSAMILLGSMAMLGLGTLLVGELARRKGEEAALISTSIVSISTASVIVTVLFTLGSVLLTHDFDVLVSNPVHWLLFVVGVVLTALTLMLDQAFIGLLRGGVQLRRNLIASVAKVLLLGGIGLAVIDSTGMWIFAAWVVSMLLSMGIPLRFLAANFGGQIRLQWGLLRELGASALVHHWLNLALDMPLRAMPIIVTVVLSPTINASFYIAWMIAGLLFFPVQSLTLVLYAVGAQNARALAEKMRSTLRMSLLIGVVGYVGIFLTADLIAGVFGQDYAATTASVLRIVCVAIFPLIIKDHFVALHRIHQRSQYAALVITVGGTVEIVLSAIGGVLGGVDLLSAAWVFAIVLQAIYMASAVFHAARVDANPAISSESVSVA